MTALAIAKFKSRIKYYSIPEALHSLLVSAVLIFIK